MRIVTSQESGVQHTGNLDIVHKQGLPGEQPRVFISCNPLTDEWFFHGSLLRYRNGKSSSGQLFGCQPDGINNVLVACTTAQVTGEDFPDVFVAGMGILFEEGDNGHEDAGGAEPALEPMRLPKCFLEGVEIIRRPQTFYRSDFMPIGLNGEHQAGAHRAVIDQYSASAANSMFTPYMSASQPEVMA
jgi:hypothetical protein